MPPTFEFESTLWLYSGKAAWVFLTLPAEIADEILDVAPATGGFGSVKVEVTIGATRWSTSLFPSAESRSFILPVKQAVRRAEAIDVGDVVRVTLSLVGA